MVLVKHLQIFQLFSLGKKGKIGLETPPRPKKKNVFDDIVNRKNGFLDNKKTIDFKNWKKLHFSLENAICN